MDGIIIRNEAELESFCREQKIEAAFLCIPKQTAESVIGRLYRLGVRCYWNFSHYDIAAKYPDAIVENVHLNDTLMTLSYRITNSN